MYDKAILAMIKTSVANPSHMILEAIFVALMVRSVPEQSKVLAHFFPNIMPGANNSKPNGIGANSFSHDTGITKAIKLTT